MTAATKKPMRKVSPIIAKVDINKSIIAIKNIGLII